ncbi:TPA_asm: RNA-directed RNA polymerase [ssRNA phage Zoerhiza.4_18]|uniref:RNA-directed RNA polymerase n=2 Tax=Norzivirales TaxID=2842247 RepID=A0A8S5KYA0_9VIRU|nr:RNA-directed RNA polymerase [ssRNA phage Zoerhiza.4_18]QDH90384.1 MAG: RNA-dependent RNA polymerase [Leviviridae sp.]DAD50148.1 TPA_asm: RNA-directed RNA polymerase [ssRNA phage Zoerhiza.4_18]
MRPKRRSLLPLQESLAAGAFSVYLRMLNRLLVEHREFAVLKPLADALRRRDFRSLYLSADSLSKQQYLDVTEHFVANQFSLLIKKYPWPVRVLDLEPTLNATKTFWRTERRAKRVNGKFSFLNTHRSRDPWVEEARKARSWIRETIGSRPNYSAIFDKCEFGSGASVGVHGNATHILAKLLSEKWSVSPGALHHGFGGLMHNYHFIEQLMERRGGIICLDYEYAFQAYLRRIAMTDYNKISFVPKTAKTHRTIAVEPLLNGFVQKGIDLELRKKLLSIGIDLSNQEVNQELAREGSLDDSENGFVTIDLQSASDSVSKELVRYLLPDDWFRLMDRTRSHHFELSGQSYLYEKFCSMGNGFCFPLETLLFVSACIAAGCGTPGVDFRVYGDDIIVRKRYASSVLGLLRHWGFTVNKDKTFVEGPFRESCGADWFGGEDVRPYTLDHALDSLQNTFKFLNLTRRNPRTVKFFESVRSLVLHPIPVEYRFFRPLPGQEDTGIDSTGDEHLTAPSCVFSRRTGKWSWLELRAEPISDVSLIDKAQDESWLIGVALRGNPSLPYGRYVGLPDVTFRNLIRTKVVRKGYSSTSNWLPTP